MTPSPRVLVIDDEKNLTFVMGAMLERAGFEVSCFNDSNEALKRIREADDGEFQVVVTDLYMPGPGGMEVLETAQRAHPRVPVVLITAFGTVESAVSALKRGAYDFVSKPFDQNELLAVVRKATNLYYEQHKEPLPAIPRPRSGAPDTSLVTEMVGSSAQMQEVSRVIGKISGSPSTVLICGESGTGKELVAYEIHRRSGRHDKPFIKINCAAIPATLIESELFGYEKGAFTGAVTSKPGRFELAHEGTLFLDEVAEMPLEMQVKLLRVLQEQEFERVGGVQSIRVDVRIITATNRNLEQEVRAGRVREDLFYRLNVVPITLPALRERREDIRPLASFFIKQFNEKLRKQIQGMDPDLLARLESYAWPGNIRQLENVIERMILMSEGSLLTAAELPDEIRAATAGATPAEESGDGAGGSGFKDVVRRRTQRLERDLIERALEETGGNVTRCAEKLGLSRKGLQLKLKELGLRPR